MVPDSCCKTSTPLCGRRDHPSNIYKVEVSAPSSGLCVDWLLVLSHLVGLLAFAGRLHLQAGAVSGRPPPGYRSGGGRSGLPAGKKASAAPHYQRVFFFGSESFCSCVSMPDALFCLHDVWRICQTRKMQFCSWVSGANTRVLCSSTLTCLVI